MLNGFVVYYRWKIPNFSVRRKNQIAQGLMLLLGILDHAAEGRGIYLGHN